MAKILAYKRSLRQVVTVDTINKVVANLGGSIAGADTTNALPNRCENLVAVYRGDVYLLYRTATNEIHLSKFNLGTSSWSDVPGFTAITTGTGVLTPTGLHVVKDRLIAVATLSLSSGADGVYARRSNQDDGDTWNPPVLQTFTSQPLDTRAGPSLVWHNAVWFTTSEGIGYYDPAADLISSTFDQGSDSAIAGQKANFGAFSFHNGSLYYVLPTDSPSGAPRLYSLDSTWSVSSPAPTFQSITLVIPGVGGVSLTNDAGNYSLFVNRAGELSLLYSGSVESKAVLIQESTSGFTLTDITSSQLPSDIASEPNVGFAFYADDRRRSNEKHTVIVRLRPSIPVAVLLFDWDGVSPMKEVARLDDGGAGLDLIVPEDERSDFRTYTANEPSVYIDATSQPFPGRVRIDYTVQDEASRPIDVTPEYSTDGQTWLAMSEGDGDDGVEGLTSTPTGSAYFFFWDAFQDLDGNVDNVDIRVVARISGV